MKTLSVYFKYLLFGFNLLILSLYANAVQFTVNITNGQVQNLPVQIYFVTVTPTANLQFDTTIIVSSGSPNSFQINFPGNSSSYFSAVYADCFHNYQSVMGDYNAATNQATINIDQCPSQNCIFTFHPFLLHQDTSLKTFQFPSSHLFTHSTFIWDFGNGDSIVTNQNHVTYTFPNYGNFNVCLTVIDSVYNCFGQYCMPVQVTAPGALCTPDFFIDQNPFGVSLSGTFINNSNFSPTAQYWLFTSSSDSVLLPPGHAGLNYNFPGPGIYNICLKMTDLFCTQTICKDVVIGDTSLVGCKADFQFTGSVNPDSSSTFVFYGTSINVSSLTSYFWNFGDGNTGTGYLVMHDYALPGLYNVTLIISDSLCTDTVTIQINTNSFAPNCNASFYVYNEGTDKMILVNNSTGNNLVYFWDFGDGNSSNDQFPTHVYQLNGSYNLCLTILDTLTHCSSSFCQVINVTTLNGRSNQMTLQVVSPNAILSTNEPDAKGNYVKLYPNPAKDNFRVEFDSNENVRLMISDYSGKLMKEIQVNSGNLVEINEMPAGIYFISIQTKSGIIREKLVKQ